MTTCPEDATDPGPCSQQTECGKVQEGRFREGGFCLTSVPWLAPLTKPGPRVCRLRTDPQGQERSCVQPGATAELNPAPNH